MTDNSSEEDGNDYIPYSRRPEWCDITPLQQDDGPNPVVVIAYSERCKSAMTKVMQQSQLTCFCFSVQEVYNYFRAIVASGEKSLRALELTTDALKLNAANYTVWQYR